MLDLDDLYLLNCNPNIFLFKAGFKLLFIFAEKISMSWRIISIHVYTNQAVIVYYTLIHPSPTNYNCISDKKYAEHREDGGQKEELHISRLENL